jgi:hypothetical protein
MSRPSRLPSLLRSKGKAPLRVLSPSSSSLSSSLRLLRSNSTSVLDGPSPPSSSSSRVITPRSGSVAIPASNEASHFVPAKPKSWSHPARLNVSTSPRPLPSIMVSPLLYNRMLPGRPVLTETRLVLRSLRPRSISVRPSLVEAHLDLSFPLIYPDFPAPLPSRSPRRLHCHRNRLLRLPRPRHQ